MSAKQSEADRMLNIGVVIKLKKLGELRVKELALEDIVKLSKEIIQVIQVVAGKSGSRKLSMPGKDSDTGENLAFLAAAVQEPELVAVLKAVAAASTGKTPHDFDAMGIGDWF